MDFKECMFFKKKDVRFYEKHVENFSHGLITILVDVQTDVHYVHSWITSGGGGITPLLDENGEVIVEKPI
ncbi:DUF6440 family protein [Cytobacillus purgationiresistens]|uniref:DUF6440 family protein n=1 Tax=Cytobacillus purgationiresistens TaxID=863449 RepID=UPI0027D83512|nr:DUF6440 family protein [Cytobacillus purgationiresistens]